jgi:hypothetical protein
MPGKGSYAAANAFAKAQGAFSFRADVWMAYDADECFADAENEFLIVDVRYWSDRKGCNVKPHLPSNFKASA